MASESEDPLLFLVVTEPVGRQVRLKTWVRVTEEYVERQIRQKGEHIADLSL